MCTLGWGSGGGGEAHKDSKIPDNDNFELLFSFFLVGVGRVAGDVGEEGGGGGGGGGCKQLTGKPETLRGLQHCSEG